VSEQSEPDEIDSMRGLIRSPRRQKKEVSRARGHEKRQIIDPWASWRADFLWK